jgi:phage shock protein E
MLAGACKSESTAGKASSKFDAAKAQAMLTAGARILDVRTPGEFRGGHLKDAINIPVQDLLRRMDELKPLDKPIIVYCQSGYRSKKAKGMLEQSGFKVVVDIGTQSGWPLK